MSLWETIQHQKHPPPQRRFVTFIAPASPLPATSPVEQRLAWAVEYSLYDAQAFSPLVSAEVLWDLALMIKSFMTVERGMREGVVDVQVRQGYMRGPKNFGFVRMWRYLPQSPGGGPDIL